MNGFPVVIYDEHRRESVTYDVLAMGRSSIDLYAHEIGSQIQDVRSFDAYVGGCPTNVSVGTRRLGLRSALLTAVGDDQVADFVTAFLDREGVETRFIPRKTGRRTSAVILTIQPPDRFPLTFYRDNCADRARGMPVDVPSFSIDVLNVLGAGDAFASGFIYGYLAGWPLERAVRMGNACGAIVVTRHGCANFMPTLDEIQTFVALRGGWEW